ncbi:MAG: hypothetical protein WBZ37_10660 [Mycobacterium sp.]
MADWAQALKAHRDAERAGQARPTTLVRLSAEVRHCERMVHDLVALARGEVVDIRAAYLPAWARVSMVCRWWTRAVVRRDNTVMFRDDGSASLAENGLD